MKLRWPGKIIVSEKLNCFRSRTDKSEDDPFAHDCYPDDNLVLSDELIKMELPPRKILKDDV